MDSLEEQKLELEALEAIFMDDFAVEEAATAEAGARFRVTLSEDDVRIRLSFTNTSNYPDSPTTVAVHALAGLSAPRRKALQSALAVVATESVSVPAAYTVCEAAREWIVEHVLGDDGENDEADADRFETIDSSSRKAVEVVASKMVGTPVTRESFLAWREKFLAEIAAHDADKVAERKANLKMTGREMFEAKVAVVSGDSESIWEMEAEGFEEEVK